MPHPNPDGAIRPVTVRALAAITLVFIAGCSTSTTALQASPRPTGGAQGASASRQNANFHVTTPNGQVSLSLNGQLPPNWPASFPVPQGATPAGSGSLAGSSSGVKVAVYTTSATAEETFAFYKATSSGLTTSNATTVGIGTSYVGRLKMSAPYIGSVTVVDHNGTTYIVIVITS